MDTLLSAIAIAISAHQGQLDKQNLPYVYHPFTVGLHCISENGKIVAMLHDVVEDTSVTLKDLLDKGISPYLVEAVDCLSRKQGESLNAYYHRVASNDVAIEVKFADMFHNSDVNRWINNDMKQAKLNQEEYYKRMVLLYNLVGVRTKELISPKIYALVERLIQ
jgi:(p)ppGpp synthase/HD superfamily hydrolase